MWGFGKSGLGFGGGGGGADLGRKVGVLFFFILMYLNARVEMGEVFNCMD